MGNEHKPTNQITEVQPEKPKLTWFQRQRIKLIIREFRSAMLKYRSGKDADDEHKVRERTIHSILELEQIFDITDDDGNVFTEGKLRQKTTDELTDILEEGVNELETIV